MKYVMLFATTIALLFSSCKKDKNDAERNPYDSPAGQLQVRFSANTIHINKVVSGFVVLQRENTTVQIMKSFVKSNNLLKIDIDDLQEGRYAMVAHIDAQPKISSGASGRQYRLQKQIRITREGIVLDAPVNALKKDWKLFATFTDAAHSVVAAIPLDCADPYFEFVINDTKWNYFFVSRKAFMKDNGGTPAPAEEESWNCDNNCYQSNHFITNTQAFKPWSDLMATKDWSSANMMVIVMNQETDEERVFLHNYDLSDLE